MAAAPVRKYFVVTLRGERGPHDRGELKQLLRDGEIQRGDQVRTATGRQLGTVGDLLSDTSPRETAELFPPPAADDGAAEDGSGKPDPTPMRRVSGRRRAAPSTPAKAPVPWVIIAVVAGVILIGVVVAMMSGSPAPVPPPAPADQDQTSSTTGGGTPRGQPPATPRDATRPATVPSATTANLTDPTTWSALDIGGSGVDGSGPVPGRTVGSFAMSAAGYDIWNSSDQFRFASIPISGDATLTVCVTHFNGSQRYDKAGLMFRASTAAGAKMVMFHSSHTGGLQMITRNADNANATCPFNDEKSHDFPVWLRLSRRGDQFTGSYSDDGQAWTPRTPITLPGMTGQILGGLAVCNHDGGAPATATFTQVAVTTP
jgi:regulation of enolase protein 1 (concanavalin A-like superfamily)